MFKLPPNLEGKIEKLPDGSYKIYARADRRRCSPLDPGFKDHVRSLFQAVRDWEDFRQTDEYRCQVEAPKAIH